MDAKATLQLLITAQDQTASVLTGVGDKIGNLADGAKQATQPFADIAEGVLKLDAALAGLAAGGLAYALKQSIDFESASIELKKVLGDQVDLLGEAQSAAKGLSGEYGVAATDVLRSTANFKQAGFDVQSAMTLAKNALDLVIAGDLDAAQASDLLIASLKGFQAPASEAGRLIDILNAVSNNYATDVQQLAVGMAELSPIAKTMGFSMEETAGVLTPVIEIFRSGGEAAVALKTGLLRLLDDNKNVVAALDSIGVSQTDANGALRSGKDILADVSRAFTSLDQNQKLFVASQLVGIEQAARMVTVFDNLGKTSEITAVALQSTGSAAEEVATQLQSTEVAINRFREGFKNLGIEIGDQFKASAKGVIDGGIEIERALTQAISSGALDPLFDLLEAKLNELGTFLAEVGQALPEALAKVSFTDLVDAFGDLGAEIKSLFGDVDLTTADGLAQAIQKVVSGIEGLVRVTSGMVDGAKPFIDFLGNAAEKATELDDETQKTIGQVTGFGAALNTVSGLAGGVIDAISGIGNGLQALAGVQLVKTVSGLVGSGGLVSALTAVAASPAGVALALAALGAAAYAAGTEIYQLTDHAKEFNRIQGEIAESEKVRAELHGQVSQRLSELSQQTGINIADMDEFNRLAKEGAIVYDDASGKWVSGSQAIQQATEESKAKLIDWGKELAGVAFGLDETQAAAEGMGKGFARTASGSLDLTQRLEQMTGASGPVAKVAKVMKEAEEGSEDFRLKMEELASNERIKALEFSVDLETARLEADARKVTAALDSIGGSVKSTGDLIGGLYATLGQNVDFSTSLAIKRQIEEENRRRQEALDLQNRLIKAQAEYMETKERQLRRGDSAIKIAVDGVYPALEMVLWEIMERVQIRVNEEATEFLLGLNPGGA